MNSSVGSSSAIILVLIITLNFLAPAYAESETGLKVPVESTIPFKQDSDVTEDTAVNAFIFVVLLLATSAIGVFYLRKKGFKGVYGMGSSSDVSILSVNRISRKTTLYRVKVNGREVNFLESSDNVLLLVDQEAE